MNPRRRILWAVSVIACLTAAGAAGYVWLEGLSWLDAVYLTVATISTVGYGDIVPHSRAGQIFTSALIIAGVGVTLYLISQIAQDLLDGHLRGVLQRRSMMRKISRNENHVVVCGFGRFGRVVVDDLVDAGRVVVVVERDPDAEDELVRRGVDYLIDSASDDEVLRQAGVEHAGAMVVATSDEAESVFITLSARELNPGLEIHARGESDSAIRRLKRAGANHVTSPYQMGGMRTAATILRPSVVDFLELSIAGRSEGIDLEEVRIGTGASITSHAIADLERDNPQLRIIALKRPDRAIQLVPDASERVEAGDHLVVIGDRLHLSRLAQAALPSA